MGKISAGVLQLFRNALNLNDDEEEVLIDLQVGKKVFHGVEKKMRSELWLSILHRKGIGISAAKKYDYYVQQRIDPQTADDISKDVHRTFPKIRRFASQEGRRALENVLRAYAAYDAEVGYCQGMNFLGGILLAWLPSQADAFGALVVLMVDRGLRELYKHDMQLVQARLWQVGKLLPAKLAAHLEAAGVLPVLYASSWLLTGFASDFPLFFSSRVMDVILTDRYVEAMMKLVVGIVTSCEERLMGMEDMEDMVEVLKVEVPHWNRERLQELLTRSFAASWNPRQLRVLEQTEGVETVIDAVARVSRASEGNMEAAPVPAGFAERGPTFSWAGNMNRQLPGLPPVCVPDPLHPVGGSNGATASPLPDRTPSGQSPLRGDLLGLRDFSPSGEDASPSMISRLSGWDPFAVESQASPHAYVDSLGDIPSPQFSPMAAEETRWTPFDGVLVSGDSPAGGNGALRNRAPLYCSLLSSFTDRGLPAGTQGPDRGPGGSLGAYRDGAGGANAGWSHDSPFSPFSEDPEVGSSETPKGLPEIPGMLSGSGRGSGSLPPRPSSGTEAKSGGPGRPVGQLSFEPRSESWGSFTSAAEPIQDGQEASNGLLGNWSADLESWGSFRQPSEDGAGPASEFSQSTRAGDSKERGCKAVVQVVSENGKGYGMRGREQLAVLSRSQSDGLARRVDRTVPAMLSASEVSLLDAAKSTPSALPPRHDSALEMDLLSRFMQEAVEQRKS